MYTQSGSFIALAGIAVTLLAKFGVSTDVSTLATIVGGVIALVGIIKQFIAHKNLAIATGKYPTV